MPLIDLNETSLVSPKHYGSGDKIPLKVPTIFCIGSTTGSEIFVYADANYYYGFTGWAVVKYSRSSLNAIASLSVGYYGGYIASNLSADKQYLYVAFNNNSGSGTVSAMSIKKIRLSDFTSVWEHLYSSYVVPTTEGSGTPSAYNQRGYLYEDGNYVYVIGRNNQSVVSSGIYRTDAATGTVNILIGLNSSPYPWDNCCWWDRYVYIHSNNGGMYKVDMVTETVVSTWTPPAYNGSPVAVGLDTFIWLPSNIAYKFTYGNNTPIWSKTLNAVYNTYQGTNGWVYQDANYVYFYNGQQAQYSKLAIADGSLIYDLMMINLTAPMFYPQLSDSDGNVYGHIMANYYSNTQFLKTVIQETYQI